MSQPETLDLPRLDSYIVLSGKITEKMPLIFTGIGDSIKRTPITIYELAKQRLLARELYDAVIKNKDNHLYSFVQKVKEKYDQLNSTQVSTGDMWIRQSKKQGGKGKAVFSNAQVLDFLKKNINTNSWLTNSGSLALAGDLEETYDSFTGGNVLELTPDEIGNFFGRGYTKQEAEESPFWRLALGDIRNDYIDFVFSERPISSKSMEIKVANVESVPTLWLWNLENAYFSGSRADCRFDDVNCSIVGVVPEARGPVRSAKTLEQRV